MTETNTFSDKELPRAIVLFDGVCHLCETTVQFILLRDRTAYFHFASLQSPFAQKLLKEKGLNTDTFDSIILIENGKVYQYSDAALRIVRKLSGAWKFLYVFILTPKCARDSAYKLIARNRYRWFGKKETCFMPQKDWRHRFL
jgi:predicted DCC family thiol-disulfide oxidoreductase YuxK